MRSRSSRLSVAALAGALGALGATSGGSIAEAATNPRLQTVATLERPVAAVWAPGSTTPLVVQQGGYVRPLTGASLTVGEPVLDVHSEVSDGGEQGLLGAAFSRDGKYLYVNLTNTEGDTEIRQYEWRDGHADTTKMRTLMHFDQPYPNHNGGHLAIDRQGYLWIATGDGGSAGDPANRAQDRSSLLGKILRIDPSGVTQDRPYAIPTGNPFKTGSARREIWAYGLRNPWKFDLDEAGGRIFIGDVGQGDVEEVDSVSLTSAGTNFGWNQREGNRAYKGRKKPKGAVDPIAQYTHSNGCSITGGVVYRGAAIPALRGRFLYGDWCKGWIASVGKNALGTWEVRNTSLVLEHVSSFNTAPDGEVWLTSTDGTVAQLIT